MAEQQVVTQEMIKKAGQLLKQVSDEKRELEKEAAASALEKRAHKVAFREVELGLCEPFKKYEDFQEKVASLMSDDLDLVEKALDRGYTQPGKTGELSGENPGKAKNQFEQFVLTGELVNE